VLKRLRKKTSNQTTTSLPVSKIDDKWTEAARRNDEDKDRFNLIASLVLKEKIFIDIGACRGDYLEIACRYIKQESIFAFEPIPFMYEHLKSSFPKSNLMNLAITDSNGEGNFFVANNEELSGLAARELNTLPTGTEFTKIQVQLSTLDDALTIRENIGLIKIDVEGNEFAVLMGAHDLIAKSRPYIYLEWGTNGPENYLVREDSIYDWSIKNSYQIMTIDGQRITSRKEFIDSFYNWPIWNYLLTPNQLVSNEF
jgi:FkbM family methyltransferase